MAQKRGVHAITPETPVWSCKIQVVDKYGPRETKEKKLRYVNMIFEDEQEEQVKAIIYGDAIPFLYEKFELYHTYLITGARVQQFSLRSEKALHRFEWVIDRKTIIDPVNDNTPEETVLPPPKKLTITSFKDFKGYHDTNAEIDVLAIVINCFQPKFTTNGRRLQELIVVDSHKKPFTFSIWEESIIENEGKKIMKQLKEYPVILARRITVSKFNGTSLSTKFNTSIQIDPLYPQSQQLRAWAVENKELLDSCVMRSTSNSGTLISLPVDKKIVPLANVQSQQDGHAFSVMAKLSLPNGPQSFYVLVCPKCGQEVRCPIIRKIDCVSCNESTILTPRCRFEFELDDDSATVVAMITGKDAEKILSLSAEEIYDKIMTKKEPLPIQDVQSRIANTLFNIHAKKSFMSSKLFIQSCVEIEESPTALPAPYPTDTNESSKRKKEHFLLSDEETEYPTKYAESLKMKQKLEPATPVKIK